MNITRKKAFSLAEVILAITIVGVIASYTVPVLMQNVTHTYCKVAFKENYSVLNQATIRVLTEYGDTINITEGGCFSQEVLDAYAEHLQVMVNCRDWPTANGKCWHTAGMSYYLNNSPINWTAYPALILNNGSMIRFNLLTTSCNLEKGFGPVVCGILQIDINGFKGPNKYGKDIYDIWIARTGIKPRGAYSFENTCSTSSTGQSCAVKVLQNKDF